QAEDGIRDFHVTGVQTCALPILPDGVRQPRQYTLSSASGSDALRITVKRVRAEDGRPAGQVSSFLHEHAVPGAVFDVTKPAGDEIGRASCRERREIQVCAARMIK